jgi:hypothetical protein
MQLECLDVNIVNSQALNQFVDFLSKQTKLKKLRISVDYSVYEQQNQVNFFPKPMHENLQLIELNLSLRYREDIKLAGFMELFVGKVENILLPGNCPAEEVETILRSHRNLRGLRVDFRILPTSVEFYQSLVVCPTLQSLTIDPLVCHVASTGDMTY